MRAIWSGAIGFGLVNIPVKMYSATQGSELSLDMLDKKDHSNIKFRRVNAETGKEVPWANIVKGYKVDDKYVILGDEDFAAASAKKSRIIDIVNFVDESEIDTIYYETPYYLEPDKNGEKAYVLLRDALFKSKKLGVGTYVLRNKEILALIKPMDKVLVLERIRFAEEIRDYNELNIPENVKVNPKELAMANTLIEQLSEKFDIRSFKDTYTGELMKLIKAKAKGAKITAPKLEVVHRHTEDLMSQLKASLNKKKKKVS